MVEVDIEELSEVITEFKMIMKKIIENNHNIADNFKELSSNWKDEKSKNLYINYHLEDKRIQSLANNYQSQLEIYEEIKSNYEKLGKKIKCNLNSKEIIINKIDNIISLLITIISQYENLGDLSFYPKNYRIEIQKNKIEKIEKDFENIKKTIEESYQNILDIEEKIKEKIQTIEVEIFTLNNYEKEI